MKSLISFRRKAMKQYGRAILTSIIALTVSMSFGQSSDSTRLDEMTFLNKVKFPTILIAGQDRSNVKACNGEECRFIGMTFSDTQKLKYKKAKILKVGNCDIEMIVSKDKLKKYQVTTNGEKETERLKREIIRELGISDFKGKTAIWTNKNQSGDIITSQLTISENNIIGHFTSWTE
jgi:hypothetical protein